MAVFRCVDCGELVCGDEAQITTPSFKCDRCHRSKPVEQVPARWEHGLSFVDSQGAIHNYAVVKHPTEDPKE